MRMAESSCVPGQNAISAAISIDKTTVTALNQSISPLRYSIPSRKFLRTRNASRKSITAAIPMRIRISAKMLPPKQTREISMPQNTVMDSR